MKLKIRKNKKDKKRALTGNRYTYVLISREGDEVDITNSLNKVEITMGPELLQANRARLTLNMEDIDVTADFVAQLEAHLATRDAESEKSSQADMDVFPLCECEHARHSHMMSEIPGRQVCLAIDCECGSYQPPAAGSVA